MLRKLKTSSNREQTRLSASSDLEQNESEEHPLDNPDHPRSLESSNHIISTPVSKQEQKKLAQVFKEDSEIRAKLVDKLMNIFMIIISTSVILIVVASLGGKYVDKELIQHFVPLLINVATGLIGVVIGYYFSGNSNNTRR